MKVEKSAGVSFALTFFFGFFGLLYSSVLSFVIVGAIYVVGVVSALGIDSSDPSGSAAVGEAIASGFIILIYSAFIWLVSIIVGIITTQRHNRKVMEADELRKEARHQETLARLDGSRNA